MSLLSLLYLYLLKKGGWGGVFLGVRGGGGVTVVVVDVVVFLCVFFVCLFFFSFFFFTELQGPATLTLLFTFRFCCCMLLLLSVLFLQFCFVVVSYPAYSSHMDLPLASQHLLVSSFL